jgi:small subunit ribosomal protein S2
VKGACSGREKLQLLLGLLGAEDKMAEDSFLVSQEQYLKAGIHIGTKFRTKYMENFIYKTRPDGLSVLNLQRIDERIRIAVQFIARYAPEDILVVSRRENSWKPVRAMSAATGIRSFTGRYMPGILTNPALESYLEAKVMLVTDAWPDRNAIRDAVRVGIPVMALCDTNNESNCIDIVIPGNNKGKKSLGLFFWILTKEYLKLRGVIKNDDDFKEPLESFTEE